MLKGYGRVVVLSFEGPDAYSSVGGLATRVSDMTEALGATGVRTSLLFVGDPHLPRTEEAFPHLEYRRCAQSVSARSQGDVYANEEEKIAHLLAEVPRYIADEVVAQARARGERTLIMMEEWQTASVAVATDRLLRERGLRSDAVILWNANNTYGFERIAWNELRAAARITVVSKFMKQHLDGMNVEPLVIPNGIAERLLAGADPQVTRALERALPGKPLFLKVGRFDPDKRWMQAIDAFALLLARFPGARLVIRGGREAYEAAVLDRAREHGMAIDEIDAASKDAHALVQALGQTTAPIIALRGAAVPEIFLRALYRVADAVLANSGREPFGLVGLEVMASGGVAVCGATGEEYAQPFFNALVCDTADPLELAVSLRMLVEHESLGQDLRAAGKRTAERYTWPNVLAVLESKAAYVEASSERELTPA